MPIAISEEHQALARTVRRWLDTHCEPKVARALLDAEVEELQPVWRDLAGQGWLGIHVPERWGGGGYGLLELAVILEETGSSLVPGPLLPTVVASAAIAESGTDPQAGELLPGLVNGSAAGRRLSGSLPPGHRRLRGRRDGHPLGRAPAGARRGDSLGGARPGPRGRGLGHLVSARRDQLVVQPLASLDPTRRVGVVEADRALVGTDRQFPGLTMPRIREVAVSLAAAEVAGGARWCLETASEYAKVRQQFGRPIGQFQAVKHKLANMLVTLEELTAVAWDAGQAVTGGPSDESALAASVAGAVVFDGYAQNAKDCVQLLGGIGFTWEHDAHLHLKRSVATRQLFGEPDQYQTAVAALARRRVRRTLVTDLPAEAERVRTELAPTLAELKALKGPDRRRALVAAGLAVPHWPRPWGRDASAVEQLVIEEEMTAAGIGRPHLAVGAWALPAIIAHGTDQQCERWVRPTLVGEASWCQLFSEPGAGSDLASLTTRAERSDGGWSLTGQKVWTSLAGQSEWGICLARTNPTAPKHQGITYFIVDMHSAGLDVRPLRELTGEALFNEVFLDSVFVPDDCVIGEVDRGWEIARLTLANERVSMSSGATFGIGVEALLQLADQRDEPLTPGMDIRLGSLLAEAQAIRLMGHRATLRSLAGADPGTGTSVQKLLGAEHEQRIQELGLAMLGPEGATTEDDAKRWTYGFLVTRCLTIAGGTSEIQRNVIAERLLGQPRDPEPALMSRGDPCRSG